MFRTISNVTGFISFNLHTLKEPRGLLLKAMVRKL